MQASLELALVNQTSSFVDNDQGKDTPISGRHVSCDAVQSAGKADTAYMLESDGRTARRYVRGGRRERYWYISQKNINRAALSRTLELEI